MSISDVYTLTKLNSNTQITRRLRESFHKFLPDFPALRRYTKEVFEVYFR